MEGLLPREKALHSPCLFLQWKILLQSPRRGNRKGKFCRVEYAAMSEAKACITCGSHHVGKFCANCGEKRPSHHDYSIAHFFEHVFETFTHFDFKALRAFKLLLFRPGFLTREYLDGKKKAFVGPIQLFVIANILFAFLGSSTFRTPLSVQLSNPPRAEMKRAYAEEARAHSGLPPEDFERSFNANAGVQAKTWIFLIIPMLALLMAILYGFRRYYFEHLVFSTHFLAFTLLWMIVAGLTVYWTLRLAGVHLEPHSADVTMSLFIVMGLIAYLIPALHRVYGGGWIPAILRSIVMGFLFFVIVQLYRFPLFFITLKTMH
jgi:hypothetical protein